MQILKGSKRKQKNSIMDVKIENLRQEYIKALYIEGNSLETHQSCRPP